MDIANALKEPTLLSLRQSLASLGPLMQRGIQKDDGSGREYFTGYAYKTLYDWDQYFEAIVQIYVGWPSDYIKNGVLIFLDNQQPTGHIPRSVPSNQFHDPEHVKPFLSQIALLVYRAYGELNWITTEPYFTRLKLYLDHWLVGMDGNRNGLSEWMSGPHTGMDNQHERAGWWRDRVSEGVDLNCYLVRECRAFAKICDHAGRPELACLYREKADERAATIRIKLWDETDGFFYDHNARHGSDGLFCPAAGWGAAVNKNPPGELIKVKTVASFAVLWAKVATPEQARRVVYEHLLNPREFWSSWPVSALAKTEPGYNRRQFPGDLGCNWRANTWIPTNYMIAAGLRWYGYDQIASAVTRQTTALINKSGNREYYDSESGDGCGLDPFWGWSLLGHFMAWEEQCGVDINNSNWD